MCKCLPFGILNLIWFKIGELNCSKELWNWARISLALTSVGAEVKIRKLTSKIGRAAFSEIREIICCWAGVISGEAVLEEIYSSFFFWGGEIALEKAPIKPLKKPPAPIVA